MAQQVLRRKRRGSHASDAEPDELAWPVQRQSCREDAGEFLADAERVLAECEAS